MIAGDGAAEVLLGVEMAQELGAGLGSTVWLSRPPRLGRKVCRDGVLVEAGEPVLDNPERQPFEVVGLLARTGIGRNAGGQVVIVDLPRGRELFAGSHPRSTFWARRDPLADNEALDASLAKVAALEVNRAALVGQAADERAFRTGVRVAGLFALVLGLFVIFHTLSMSLTERVTEVGTLHALGATRRQIARVFFTEAVVQSLAGGVLGITLGLAMAKGLLFLGLTTLGSGKHIELFVVPWPSVLALAAAGVGMALCGSVYPLLLMGGADPGAALRGDQEISAHRRSRGFAVFFAALVALMLPALYFILVPSVGVRSDRMAALILGAVAVLIGLVLLALVAPRILALAAARLVQPLLGLWPFAARLARSGMVHSPGRIGASASAIALVAAGFVGLRGLTDSLRGEIDTWAAEAVQHKVFVRGLPPTDFAELAKHLHGDEAVLGVEMGQAQINVPFLILGLDLDELAHYGPLADNPELLASMRTGRGMILSRRLAQDGLYETGDSIYLETRARASCPSRWLPSATPTVTGPTPTNACTASSIGGTWSASSASIRRWSIAWRCACKAARTCRAWWRTCGRFMRRAAASYQGRGARTPGRRSTPCTAGT
ncbi:MAG: FtsX-like permease family protein [Planctomycetota bacterium]